MRKLFILIVMLAVAAVSLTSCLGDGTTYTYYDDAAITSFKLGTVKRVYHYLTDDELDTTYTNSVSCAGYAFNIDQQRGLIWNQDSLPFGLDPAKALCTVSAKNSGSIGIKSLTSDSLSSYSSTDTVDFSQPRIFYVYNSNGTGYRTYTVTVNVHQEKPDTCIWAEVTAGNSQLAKLSNMKAFSLEDNVYLFGNEGTTPKLYTTTLADGLNWTELATTPTLSTEAYKSIILKNGVFFCISDGKLLKSVDATNWQEIGDTDLKQLVAATSVHLYALSADYKMMSSANDGLTWVEEELDEDASLLPTEDLSYACRVLQTNDNAEKVVLIGNRSLEAYPDDTTAVVWTKIDEYGDNAHNFAWSYTTQSPVNKHKAPRAKNWQIISYDYPNFKGICGDGVGSNTTTALGQIYQSGDDGITWLNDSVMTMPSALSTDGASFAMTTDKEQSVWIICGGTGQVWKTRINRLAWRKDQEIFE